MRFFTSDLHIGHTNVIKYCNRPYKDVTHMNESLISNWNEVVTETDEVFVLGDFSLDERYVERTLARLSGTKYLIMGNHDLCFKRPSFIEKYVKRGFKTVQSSGEVEIGGVTFLMNHFPYTNKDPRFVDKILEDRGTPLLSAHVHEKWQVLLSEKGTFQLNVGVDSHNYYPISEEKVLDIAKEYAIL
jgi:calcineurin-like phosphoesterase family protein